MENYLNILLNFIQPHPIEGTLSLAGEVFLLGVFDRVFLQFPPPTMLVLEYSAGEVS